jgi:hypothetical protein
MEIKEAKPDGVFGDPDLIAWSLGLTVTGS